MFYFQQTADYQFVESHGLKSRGSMLLLEKSHIPFQWFTIGLFTKRTKNVKTKYCSHRRR